MFAVIKTGGKQYKIAANDVITVEKLSGDAGSSVVFDEVLMITGDAGSEIGTPMIAGARVAGEIVKQTRSAKSISFVKRRRQNSKRKKGHRQDLTMVRITEILAQGAEPKSAAKSKAGTSESAEKPKAAAKPKAKKAEIASAA